MSRVSKVLEVNEEEIEELKGLANGLDPVMSLRAKIILEGLDGTTNKEVAQKLGIDQRSVALWKEKYRTQKIDGLKKTFGGGVKKPDEEIVEAVKRIREVIEKTDDWTILSLSNDLGISLHIVKTALDKLGGVKDLLVCPKNCSRKYLFIAHFCSSNVCFF